MRISKSETSTNDQNPKLVRVAVDDWVIRILCFVLSRLCPLRPPRRIFDLCGSMGVVRSDRLGCEQRRRWGRGSSDLAVHSS